MSSKVPIFMAGAGYLVTIGTTLANSNGVFAGHPHLYLWLYGAAGLLVLIGVALTARPDATPNIVAARYGKGSVETGIKSRGYPTGAVGLIVVNDGEPAYEIGAYPPRVPFNWGKLHLGQRITRLTKLDGEGELAVWIEELNGGAISGDGLFQVMRQKNIDEINIPIFYKGAKNQWYKSICKIERDVTVMGGLAVKTEFRGRTGKPKTTDES